MRYYPICLSVNGRRCLVVGGGAIGLEKTRPLVAAGARVRVVSPAFDAGFDDLPEVERVLRPFQQSDLDGVFLAIAATDDTGLNRAFAAACEERGILYNVVDVPELCQFIVPAVVDRGNVTLAIFTHGNAPAFSGRLRREAEEWLPEDIEAYVAFLSFARGCGKRAIASVEQRFAYGRYLASREGYEAWRQRNASERKQWLEDVVAAFKEGRQE
jgi:siroheme synthase-like protein